MLCWPKFVLSNVSFPTLLLQQLGCMTNTAAHLAGQFACGKACQGVGQLIHFQGCRAWPVQLQAEAGHSTWMKPALRFRLSPSPFCTGTAATGSPASASCKASLVSSCFNFSPCSSDCREQQFSQITGAKCGSNVRSNRPRGQHD